MPEPSDSRVVRKLHTAWDTLLGNSIPAGPARRNWRMIMVIQTGWAAFLGTSIMSTYYTQERGLSNTQVYVLQATWALVSTLGTTAGGWLADRYGIRKIMLYGTGLHLLQSVYFATCDVFWQFEVALILSGIMMSLLNGSTDTLCTASLRREVADQNAREELYKQYQRTVIRLRAFTGIVAILVGNFLATHIDMRLPFILQGIVYIAPAIAAWRVTEPREPAPQLMIVGTIRKQLRVLMVDRPDIRWAVAVFVITGAASVAGFWLVQPLMIDIGISRGNFGWIYACQSLCIALFTWVVKPLQKATPVVLWGWIGAVTGFGALAAGLSTGYVGLAIMLVGFSLSRACLAACLGTYLFKRLGEDDVTRSIDISIVDAIQTLVFAAVGIGVGVIADGVSTQAACLVIGGSCIALNSIALFGLWRATRVF